ncbi:MAG: hypothetical protein HGA25_03210 [Clostridiales bacterium]|nr:hypothetical protein [Clostridiales bacterium]
MYYRAVDGVSKDILIVDKESKIIARGVSIGMRGNDFVAIRLAKEDFEKLLSGLSDMAKSLMHSIGHIRCCPISGMFIQPTLDLGDDENGIIENIFADTYAVSEFDLRYRMVPDFFKNVEGYGSCFSEKDN